MMSFSWCGYSTSGCLTRQINRVGQAVASSTAVDATITIWASRLIGASSASPVSAPALWISSLDPAFRLCRTRIRSPRW